MGSCSEVSIPVTNFIFKNEIEQNPNQKAIVKNCFDQLVADSKAKVDVVVQNIARLLYAVDRKELDHDHVSLKIVPDDLHSVLLNKTMDRIRREQDRMSLRKLSFEWRRRVYNLTIMIAVIIMLAVSVGLAVAGERMAAVVTATLAMTIKATETYMNVMLSEEERMLEGDEKVIEMMQDGEWLLVHEFNNVQQKANTLNKEIEAERWKLKEQSGRMEKSEMKETIKKIKGTLKNLKSVVNGYGNEVHQFGRKFTNMVKN